MVLFVFPNTQLHINEIGEKVKNMYKPDPICCPYCQCTDITHSKDIELIEIGEPDFEQSWEEMPIDIWTCSECQRRFFVMGSHEDEDAKPSD